MSTNVNQPHSSDKVDRRKFIGLATATAVMFIKPELVRGTAANSAVRVGLLGCGGRGTEDASNLVDTGNARVVALADLFRDQLDAAHAHFDEIQKAKRYAAIDAAQLFVGPSAYKEIAASKDVDAITGLVAKISEFAAAHPAVREIDLNPVVAYSRGLYSRSTRSGSRTVRKIVTMPFAESLGPRKSSARQQAIIPVSSSASSARERPR